MFRDSLIAVLGARFLVLTIRSITPLCILYCCLIWTRYYPIKHWFPFILGIYASLETAFFFLVYIPRYLYLQQPTTPAPPSGRLQERQALFQKCIDTIPDPERFISLWNRGTPVEKIHRENLKEWVCWAFLNKGSWTVAEDDELEEYVCRLENLLGYRLPEGKGSSKSMRVFLDWVNMLHRPLIYYVGGVGLLDIITYFRMRYQGYQHYTVSSWFLSFPFRPQTTLSKHRSSSKHFSYWYRPHTSPDTLPILFIHGMGILFSYQSFFNDFSKFTKEPNNDGIGLIAIETLPISFRMSHPALLHEDLCTEILSILDHHGWNKFVLTSASYGTAISSQLLRDNRIAPRIGPMILVDPIPFLLHLPVTTYNFTRRKPRSVTEILLHYFASTDMGAAHTLCRRFFWNECILWKEDLMNFGRRTTVVFSERDMVIDAHAIGEYLTRNSSLTAIEDRGREDGEWKSRWWTGGELDILWFEGIDHGEILNAPIDRKILIEVVLNYCRGESTPVTRRDAVK